jgi:hypothetical protein
VYHFVLDNSEGPFVLQIKSRGSRIRGELISIIRSQVASCYGFDSDTSRTKVVRQNRKLYDNLIFDSTFIYKVCLNSVSVAYGLCLLSFPSQNTKDREGYAQNKIFGIVIQEAWFSSSSKSKGVIFEKYFNPISLETLALLFTMVRSCLFKYVVLNLS